MDYDLDTGAHATYSQHDHLGLVVNYRREVFTEELSGFSREVVSGFGDNYGVEIRNLEADRDHVHLLFNTTHTTDLAKFINVLNGASARRIRNEYGDQIEDKLWGDSFWTDSYWLISTGEVSLDVLDEYVENQRKRADE